MDLCSLCQKISPWSLKRVRFDHVRAPKPEKCILHHQSFVDLQESGAAGCVLCQLMCKSLLANKYTPFQPLHPEAPILLAFRQTYIVYLNVSAPQWTEIIVACGERWILLAAFAEEGCEAARMNAVAGRRPCDPGSREGFEIVSKWLQDCLHNHSGCRIGEVG